VTLSVRIAQIKRETAEIASFALVAHDGASLPPYTSGAHIDVHLAPGLTRQYSLCEAPGASGRYLIAVKREANSRGGSRAMHELKEGQPLEISAPRNNFPLASASHHVLLAGGIGVTPLLSMAQHLQRLGESFELQYFTRSVEHTAFHDRLSAPELRAHVAFHYALDPERLRAYLRQLLWHRRDGAHLYLCGPRPFMDLVEATAAPTWPPEAVHLEYFSADPSALSGTREAFDIVLASSGARYTVPADQTIIQVLSEHGTEVPTSCEQGVCGTCLTGVLDGEPDHRDVFLTDEEKRECDRMLPCVSRARSPRLTLDL
jgi:vanillate O-demethylase ferredoxin subunit